MANNMTMEEKKEPIKNHGYETTILNPFFKLAISCVDSAVICTGDELSLEKIINNHKLLVNMNPQEASKYFADKATQSTQDPKKFFGSLSDIIAKAIIYGIKEPNSMRNLSKCYNELPKYIKDPLSREGIIDKLCGPLKLKEHPYNNFAEFPLSSGFKPNDFNLLKSAYYNYLKRLGLPKKYVSLKMVLGDKDGKIYIQTRCTDFRNLNAKIWDSYENQVNHILSDSKDKKNDLLKLILETVCFANLSHPYIDFNARTNAIILNKELMRFGFNPCIVYTPYLDYMPFLNMKAAQESAIYGGILFNTLYEFCEANSKEPLVPKNLRSNFFLEVGLHSISAIREYFKQHEEFAIEIDGKVIPVSELNGHLPANLATMNQMAVAYREVAEEVNSILDIPGLYWFGNDEDRCALF